MQLTPKILQDTDTNEPIAPMTLASQVFREDGTTMLDALWFDAEDEEIIEDIDIATKNYVDGQLNGLIKRESFTLTSSSAGNVQTPIRTSNRIVDAYGTVQDSSANCILMPFRSRNATTYWYFAVFNASGIEKIGNATINVVIDYI